MKTSDGKKVIVALSGGVDSSVSASILVDKGYQVEGVFMKNWSGDDFAINGECPWKQDQEDAQNVAIHLGIPFRSVNFEKEYRRKVVDYFFDEYKKGRTPNPDVMCNKEIKFHVFLDKAKELGADYIATGHYARIEKSNDTFLLKTGIDDKKDQSYFLHKLNQEQLKHTMFPIGNLTKSEVREYARSRKLPVANKKDSQGICFIGKINVHKFLKSHIKTHTGNIVDKDTNLKVGEHEGIEFYTIGQRGGLGIGGLQQPYYVTDKDLSTNTLFVVRGDKNKKLYKKIVYFENPNFISGKIPNITNIQASIRYRHKPAVGTLDTRENKFIFLEEQRAITPGQSIVFYDNDVCIGGATIL